HYSFNESPIFKGSHFYQQVFPEDSARICESVHGAGIREYLEGFLPQYMMPSYIVELEELPLNSHGKVDYQALPEPGEKEWQQRMAIVGPGNATEAGLLAIWQDVLKREHISVRDPFFTVGGHSLRAAQLIARIHREFGVSLELKDLFVNPTIAELASKIAASNADVEERIRPVEDQVHYAVSHAQKRLWLLHQQEDNLNIYNSPIVMELKGDFSPGAFNNAMQALTARHESLRTVFVTISGEPRQRVVPPEDARYRVSYQDLRGETDTDKRISALIRKHSHTPFDLERGPLWRCSILHTADNAYLLLFAIHHIITDAVSMRVLLKELMLLYRQQTLPSLSLQYRDYATWQRSQLRGEWLEGHRNYWRRQFGDEVPVLDLQTDYSRTAQADHEGDSVNITLDPVITQQLRQYAGENNATLFMTLLALVNALLYKYTGQTDIVTGTNVAGRDHQDLENQIGLFLNTLPLRVSFDEDKGLSELLTTVKTAVLGAFTHQAYPFDLLVGGLNIPHERSRNPLFDVEVELINVELDNTAAGEMDNMEARGYENGFSGAKDDLSFRFTEAGGRLMLSLRFRTALFERSTIERMAAHFIQVTTHALNSPGTPLSALDYMTAAEKEQILSAFKEQ
ncbi:MAG TPA: condensation domain-containing protein, partial [Chitinophaga sp.]